MSWHRNLRYFALIGLVFIFAGLLWAQRGPDKKLEVNGRTMDSPILQIGGRSYVDLETLARITNGVIAVQPDRVVLTIPTATAPSAARPSPPPDALSREFAREAIGLLAEMREWRGGVEADLQRVAVAAVTPGDQQALQLLRNEFDNLSNWADSLIAERQSLNATKTVDPNITQNDQALAKLSACSNFLSSILVSGTFSDDASCH